MVCLQWDPDTGKLLHFLTGSRKSLARPFWLVALVAAPKSHTLQREGNSASCWLSRGTELSPELVGHLHMLLCWEHSTLLTCTAQPPWVCWHCWHQAALVTHRHRTCRFLASTDVGEAALPQPGRLALVQDPAPGTLSSQGLQGKHQIPAESWGLIVGFAGLGWGCTAESGWPDTDAGRSAKLSFPCLESTEECLAMGLSCTEGLQAGHTLLPFRAEHRGFPQGLCLTFHYPSQNSPLLLDVPSCSAVELCQLQCCQPQPWGHRGVGDSPCACARCVDGREPGGAVTLLHLLVPGTDGTNALPLSCSWAGTS